MHLISQILSLQDISENCLLVKDFSWISAHAKSVNYCAALIIGSATIVALPTYILQ